MNKFKQSVFWMLLIWCVLFITSTFFDLQISNKLVGTIPGFGKFWEVFGLLPLSIVRIIVIVYFVRFVNVMF